MISTSPALHQTANVRNDQQAISNQSVKHAQENVANKL